MAITLENLTLVQGGFSLSANLSVKPDQITAVIGPSGGGKSTLLMLIAGFIRPDSGRVVIGGKDMSEIGPAKRPLSVLFQENNLFPHLSIFQNIALGIKPNLKLSPTEKEAASLALNRVGLSGRGKDLPEKLSGGQRQRVALARALLRKRSVLLLDEPFAALGPALRHEMLDLVAEIQRDQNATVLLVTHNPEDAQRIAADTVLVVDGQVSAPEQTTALFTNPPKALAAYLGLDGW